MLFIINSLGIPVASSVILPIIPLSIFISNALSLCSSLWKRETNFHTHTKQEVKLQFHSHYILIFGVLDARWQDS
jgi:hypothetical protein